MRKFLKCSAFWLLIACMVLQPIYIPKASAAEPGKTVTILFTHDMHDNFLPFKTEQNGTNVFSGEYARLQSAIDTQKELDENALVLDAGDFSMGTPFQTIYQSDSPGLRILGQMGYDVVTLGNHEYDYRANVHYNPNGGTAYIPLATNAVRMGNLVGKNINGPKVRYRGTQSTSGLHLFGYNIGSTGVTVSSAPLFNLNVRSVIVKDNYRPEFMPT